MVTNWVRVRKDFVPSAAEAVLSTPRRPVSELAALGLLALSLIAISCWKRVSPKSVTRV
jgi:hypothetical protein